jgi:hypothetical protein
MTTIATTHHRTPLVATLAAGAALVVGAGLGVAWEQNNHDTSPAPSTQAAATTPESFGGATTGQGMSGAADGHLRDTTRFGGSTTSQGISGAADGHLGGTTPFGGSTTGQESTQ